LVMGGSTLPIALIQAGIAAILIGGAFVNRPIRRNACSRRG